MERVLRSAITTFLIGCAAQAGATTITVPGGGGGVGNFIDTQVYGQTFIAPAEPVLTGATFSARSITGQEEALRIELFGYDAATETVSGPVLFDTTATLANTPTSFSPLTVTTGGWTLVPGERYVLAASHDDGVGRGQWEIALSDVYTDGEFRVSDTGSYLTDSWTPFFGVTTDLAFTLTFEEAAQIPLPPALPMLLAGLAGIALLRRRR